MIRACAAPDPDRPDVEREVLALVAELGGAGAQGRVGLDDSQMVRLRDLTRAAIAEPRIPPDGTARGVPSPP
jgi:hypothetical protein